MLKKNCVYIKFIHNYRGVQKISKNPNLLVIKILLYINLILFFFNSEVVSINFFKKKKKLFNINRAPYRFKTSRHQLGICRFLISLKIFFKLSVNELNFNFFNFLIFLSKLSSSVLFISRVSLYLALKNIEWAKFILIEKK